MPTPRSGSCYELQRKSVISDGRGGFHNARVGKLYSYPAAKKARVKASNEAIRISLLRNLLMVSMLYVRSCGVRKHRHALCYERKTNQNWEDSYYGLFVGAICSSCVGGIQPGLYGRCLWNFHNLLRRWGRHYGVNSSHGRQLPNCLGRPQQWQRRGPASRRSPRNQLGRRRR